MFLNLAKGQEELKALITKEKKKNTKKLAGILNMGIRFRGPVKRVQDPDTPLDEDGKQVKDDKNGEAERSNHGSVKYSDEDEEDYLNE